MSSLRTVVAVESRLYREGMAMRLSPMQEIQVVGMVSSVSSLMATCQRERTDLLIVDALLGNSLQFLLLAHGGMYNARFILLNLTADHPQLGRLVETPGYAGYLLPEQSFSDLQFLVRQVANSSHHAGTNKQTDDNDISDTPQGRLLMSDGQDAMDALTRQQIRILAMLESGCSNKEISRQLKIEISTVKNHVHNILQRLGVNNRGEAAALFRRSNLPAAMFGGMTLPGLSF